MMLVDPKKGYIFYGTGILLLLLAGIIFYAVNLSGSLAISKHSSPTTDISQVAELIPIPEQKKHGIKIANMVNPMLKTLGKRREEPFFDNGINILGKIFVAFSLILSIGMLSSYLFLAIYKPPPPPPPPPPPRHFPRVTTIFRGIFLLIRVSFRRILRYIRINPFLSIVYMAFIFGLYMSWSFVFSICYYFAGLIIKLYQILSYFFFPIFGGALSQVAGFGILAISLVYICGLTIFPFILHLWTEFLNICQAIEVPELPGKSKIAYFFSRIKSRFSRRNLDDTYPHPSAPSYYTEQQPAFNPYFKEEEEPK
ncbi:hypothetical protein MDAP_002446 [Mitosporidium daphniae]